MKKSKQLKDKAMEGTQLPHFKNLQLLDLPGEVWKSFPVAPFDENYLVSNKGRIKRLPYIAQRSDGVSRLLPERVIRQNINRFLNNHVNKDSYTLSFVIKINKYGKNFMSARMVYYAFIEPFDLSDKNLIVRPKDGNGLNCAPSNLYLFARKNLGKWISENDRRSRFSRLSDRTKWSEESLQKWEGSVKKVVSQYDLEGHLIQTFSSRREAGRSLGISHSAISAVIKGKVVTAGGFLWREGSDNLPRIDVPPMGRRPTKVAQYSLEGDLIHLFRSINKASIQLNITGARIALSMKRQKPLEDFIFKKIEYTQKPPAKIMVELPPNEHKK